jgi:acyl-CoA dehydrogenase
MLRQSNLPAGIEPNAEREQIATSVQVICDRFDDDFWLAKDQKNEFPSEFHAAMAESGWLGITMPTEYGGADAHRGSVRGCVCGMFIYSH